MIQKSIEATQKPLIGESPDWDVIAHELISHLRSDYVKLTGSRVAVEAVISSTVEGEAVTSLDVAALTPKGKEIVRYKLAPRPMGALASDLAATISSAQLAAMPTEQLVSAIARLVDIDGSHYFVHNIPPTAVEASTTMHRVIPSFSAFARDPRTMDGQFIADRVVGDTRIRAKAKLFPDFKEAVIEANAFSHASTQASVSHAFKVRCPDSFWKQPKTTAEITAELMKVTWEAMDSITTEGPAVAHKRFSSPQIDDRIAHGVINPRTAEKNLELRSGARVLLEVGDSVACIATQAVGSEDSTMFSWVIAAKNGALSPEDTRLITARAAVEKLAYGSSKERKNAIATLDLMAHKAFKTPSLESVVGYELADSLRQQLNNSIARVGDPRSEARILDNLDGIQHIELVFRDPAYSRRRPQDPWLMSLGFGQDGELKVELFNPLGNHLSALLPAETVNNHGGVEQLSGLLTGLFDKQTTGSFLQLRAVTEDLAIEGGGGFSDPERTLDPSKRMPSTRDVASNRAYDIVAELAKVYQSVTGASISEIQVTRRPTNQYDVAFCNQVGKNKVQLHLNVLPAGISRVELIHDTSGAHEAESFAFTPPLRLPQDQGELTRMFEDFNSIIAADDDATTSPLPNLTSTRLYTRLKSHETPHTLSD